MFHDPSYENTPIYGCRGCASTGGRANCPDHGTTYTLPTITIIPSRMFVTIKLT